MTTDLWLQLRSMRHKKGWSQERAALELNTTQAVISRLESQKRLPSIKMLLRIASVFNKGLLVRFVPFSPHVEVIIESEMEKGDTDNAA